MFRKWLAVLLVVIMATPATAALTSYPNLTPAVRSLLQNTSLFVKGNADNNLYLLEVDPATGALPVTGTVTATNASTGLTGAAVPTSATYDGMNVGGNLTGLSGTASGLKVDVQASVLPTGAATEATLAAASAKLPATLGQKAMAASLACTIASDQSAVPASQSGTWNITNVSGTVSLPTGAATETTLAAASAKLPATLGQKAMAASMAVVLASDQTSIPVSESGTWNITNVSGTVSLPTGAATLTAQGTGNTSLASIDTKTPALGQAAKAASSPVVIASDQGSLTVAASNLPTTADTNVGASSASTLRQVAAGRSLTTVLATYDYTGGTVTTAAYTQVVASTSAAITRIHIFDSSGSAIIIATGAALSEVDRIYLPPGGSGFPYEVTIPASTRIAIKALDTSASTGRMIITGLQ